MLKCSVLRGFPVGFGAPSGSIASGCALDQRHRLLEIGDRAIELPDRDVAVAAVAIHARVVRVRAMPFENIAIAS